MRPTEFNPEQTLGQRINLGAFKQSLLIAGKNLSPAGLFLLMVVKSYLEEHDKQAPLSEFMEYLDVCIVGNLDGDIQETTRTECIRMLSIFAGSVLARRAVSDFRTEEAGRRDALVTNNRRDVEASLYWLLRKNASGTTPPSDEGRPQT